MSVPPPPSRAASLRPHFTPREETRRLLIISAPLIVAYLADFAMFATIKLVVGELGFKELAAVGLGASLTFEVSLVLAGLLSITAVLAAQAEGAGRKAEAGNAMRQGMIVAALIGLPMSALVWNIDAIMRWTGQDPEVIALAAPFGQTVAFYVLPSLFFVVARDFTAALSRTRAVMVISFLALPLNWALAEGLVHGRFGLPAMGVAGAGATISIIHWGMLFALIGYIYFTPALRGYGVFRGRLRVDLPVIGEVFRLGLPIAGLVAVEAGMFTAVGLLSGRIGAEMLAAHQVLMAWIGIPFVIAAGLAEGAMVRVAHGVGRGDAPGARQAGFVGLALGAGLLILLVVFPLTLAEEITAMFVSADDPGHGEVLTLVTSIMTVAAIFQVFDGAQVIMARSLRGLKDGYYPLWLGAFGYWVMGIGGGYVLAFPVGWGGEGLWIGLAMGLIVTAILLTARFALLSRRLIKAARAG
ncbi:MAG: MATE family efflux transporter [Pseudomonadota bacterium]